MQYPNSAANINERCYSGKIVMDDDVVDPLKVL